MKSEYMLDVSGTVFFKYFLRKCFWQIHAEKSALLIYKGVQSLRKREEDIMEL
jgi:hypothetical protein